MANTGREVLLFLVAALMVATMVVMTADPASAANRIRFNDTNRECKHNRFESFGFHNKKQCKKFHKKRHDGRHGFRNRDGVIIRGKHRDIDFG